MLAYVEEEDNPPLPETIAFIHDEDDVYEICGVLVASDFRTLPDAGGWLDQQESWTHDIFHWLALRAWAKAQKKERDGVDNLIDRLGGKQAAPDWQNLLGE